MSSLMGMNRFFAGQGIQGLGNAANMQTQRENTKTQLEAAHDASVMGTTSSMAGVGGMAGFLAGPAIAGMMGGAAPTTLAVGGSAIPVAGSVSGAGLTGASVLTGAGTPAAMGAAATPSLLAGSSLGAGGAAAAGGATAGGAGAGAVGGVQAGSAAGPIGAVVGLGLGALAGWLMSELG